MNNARKKNIEVSVIVPCYNESESILSLIDSIHQQLLHTNHEIIVVDDNSPDGTYSLVKNTQHTYLRAFLRTDDRSLGKSIRFGIENALGAAIVVMDSDGNHKPESLPILLENLKYYDCVSASRFVYGGSMGNRFRHISSWLFNVFTRIVTRTYVTDSLFGYYSIRRDVLKELDFDKIYWGFGDYCIRFMYYMQKNNATILQIPGVLGQRIGGQGNTRMIKTLLQYAMEVIKLILFSSDAQRSKKHE
jgi:dolichol-phosphate mannosyltransferase